AATIVAPPRLFLVETASALAVDQGCAYRIDVDDRGAGEVHVTAGWITLSGRDREAVVPAGATCPLSPDSGPGIPVFDDAPAALREALARTDLDAILAAARPRDALTLWHLVQRAGASERGRVFDRLAALAPPPAPVTRDGVVSGNAKMLA